MKIVTLASIKTALRLSSIGKAEMLFSAIFTVILVSGYLLSTYETLDAAPLGAGSILVYFCGSVVVWALLALGLAAIGRSRLRKPETTRAIFLENFSDKKLWLLTSLAIFICYLPVILLSLSVLTPDSWSSIAQSTGEATLTNAHPIIFTTFVSIFIHIGLLFGSVELGAILFSVVQSAILAMIFAQILVWMRREKISRGFIVATFLFYAILPINAIAGTIMWKDILFAGFGLLLLMLVRQLYMEKDAFFTKKNVIYFILLTFLFCTWRNNGFYAYLLFLILAIIINRKTFFNKKYLSLLLSPIVMFAGYSVLVTLITSPAPGTVMLSVPIQQIARTVKYHSNTISEEDRHAIGEILSYGQLDKLYNPNLADPVLYTFNEKAFKEDEGKYIKLWFKLFMEHKKTYIAASLYNTYGYIYPFNASSTITDIAMDNASHFNAPKGYSDIAYSDGGKLALGKYRDLIMSIVPLLHNIGFYTCIILLGAYIAVIRRRRELTGVFIILSCLFLTTILGPVNSEFRYLYLFVVAAPLVIGSAYYCHNPERTKKTHAK